MQPLPGPTGIDWWDKYGAIGAVAFFALTALTLAVRQYWAERREEKAKTDREKQALQTAVDQHQKSLADLNAKLIEIVQQNHTETLELLDAQRDEHEQRFQALLERHIATSDAAREKTLELASSVTKVISSLTRKLKEGSDDRAP